MTPAALTIAGTDPTGGAGIARDLFSFARAGVRGLLAVTAVTVQDEHGVRGWHEVPADVLSAQIDAARGLGVDAVKTGMLPSAGAIRTVVAALDLFDGPLVVDPVLAAGTGGALSDASALDVLRAELIPRAILVTPNAPEAGALTGVAVVDEETAAEAALALVARGARNVLVTGGHLSGDQIVDVLEGDAGSLRWRSGRVEGIDTHGTGCALSAGICAGLATGLGLADAIERAIEHVGEWLAAGGWRAR
jgi:hydroxymethylpyrimidine/phosphomethylpyrimidine kinase